MKKYWQSNNILDVAIMNVNIKNKKGFLDTFLDLLDFAIFFVASGIISFVCSISLI